MKKIPEELLQRLLKNRKARVETARQSHEWFFPIYFAHYMTYPMAAFQEEIFELTERPEPSLYCIVSFRGSGKSTIVSTSYALWSILGVQRKKYVVIFCQTKAQAKQTMMNLRAELETNPTLKNDMTHGRAAERGVQCLPWGLSTLPQRLCGVGPFYSVVRVIIAQKSDQCLP